MRVIRKFKEYSVNANPKITLRRNHRVFQTLGIGDAVETGFYGNQYCSRTGRAICMAEQIRHNVRVYFMDSIDDSIR